VLPFESSTDDVDGGGGHHAQPGGTTVPATYSIFAQGYGVELKPTNLLTAGQTYQVAVGAGLRDTNGIGAAANPSFQFTTGTGPDTQAALAVAASPQYGVSAPLNPVVTSRANKRIMPLATVEYSLIPAAASGDAEQTIPVATASLSADGQNFTYTPGSPLTPGIGYVVSLTDMVDVTGAMFSSSGASFIAGAAALTSPPTVLAITPPDGSQNVALNSPIEVAFSAPIGAPHSAQPVILLENGQPTPSRLHSIRRARS